jgi:lipopolysaccharide/colanic/teichoic acid biosynthesis glycosyltransferase
MPGYFHRAIDEALIVLGAVGALYIRVPDMGRPHALDPSLVAFVAALALSVFPACGTYSARCMKSLMSAISRTTLAWLAVQMCGLALLYVIHRIEPLSMPWFIYWTLASGISLLISHTVTLFAFDVVWPRGRRAWRAAFGGGVRGARPATEVRPRSVTAGHIVKRGFDITVGAALIVVLSPVLAALAIVVRRDGGPAFYGHVRVGQNGRKFRCMKFRSMVVNADQLLKHLLDTDPLARAEWERSFKLKHDVRVTRIGRFLRRTSLDELPQLWNVMRGEMSLVGPRPVVDKELERYGTDVRYYLQVRPGMTGLWQVSGRSDADYVTRVSLDVAYVRNWSLFRDVTILFRTIRVVVKGRGAY